MIRRRGWGREGDNATAANMVVSVLKELHLDYIVAAANLKAFMCGLPPFTDRAAIKDMVSKVKIPEFVPKSGIKIDVTDAEAQARSNNDSFGKLKEKLFSSSVWYPSIWKGLPCLFQCSVVVN